MECFHVPGVLKCLNKDEKVPELPYEMRGDLFCGLEHRGPAKARERALTVSCNFLI